MFRGYFIDEWRMHGRMAIQKPQYLSEHVFLYALCSHLFRSPQLAEIFLISGRLSVPSQITTYSLLLRNFLSAFRRNQDKKI